jgi:transketolase
LKALTEAIPELIGGSADLTGSVNTKTPSTEPITPDNFANRYVYYGVREHGMAAIMNGIALHKGFIPYSGTFLVFADYMKGAMRLSALMGQRVIYVLTHDSIGLGEDGPTHQPVETLASLRALPNFKVFRPADQIETAECWALALSNSAGPSGMVLTRQGVPLLREEHTNDNLCARGGYVLAKAEGIPTAVVSMPCWELFDEQDPAYRDMVLGPGTVRVAVEAAVSFGWERYIGSDGGFVGMTGFGASAPAPRLYEHFGITADAVAAQAKARL